MSTTESGEATAVQPPIANRLAAVLHVARAPLGALRDAARAWRVSPPFFAHCSYEVQPDGALRVSSRRRFTPRERLMWKARAATRVFRHSLSLRAARAVFVAHAGGEGLMANLLHVMEVLHRVRPDAQVHVSWRLRGNERGFRYGKAGDDVWTKLFQPLHPPPPKPYVRADHELDLALWGTGKDYLRGAALQRQRHDYGETASRWLTVANPRVLAELHQFESVLGTRFAIGIHRRVDNALVPNLQRDGVVPSLEQLFGAARANIPPKPTDYLVLLATDDEAAIGPAREAFGNRLVVREGIKRTSANGVEVPFGEWGSVALADAEDVLIDTMMLARCDVLVHASSSVSTMAALLRPPMRLVRIEGAASRG